MSIRIRKIRGTLFAFCAAKTRKRKGDVYLDDAQHTALGNKYAADYNKMYKLKIPINLFTKKDLKLNKKYN